ncbi:Imidazoleglycerol-phosphate dehydratase [Bienertia sinuspersici]
MTVYDSFASWINSFLACIGSCLGRCAKPKPTSYVEDNLPKGLRCQGQMVEKNSVSDDFWGTSTGDIDFPNGLSQRSISSMSTSNVSFHSDLGSANMNSQNDFVNHGLLLWTQLRLQWIGITKSDEHHQSLGPTISLNATYNSLLGSRERFRRPIPLSEMVEFLVDVWEQEGLYD